MLVVGFAADRSTRFSQALKPKTVAESWTPETYVLSYIYDVLAGANWQRGGGKGRRPKPFPRPGEKDKNKRWRGRSDLTFAEYERRLRLPRKPVAGARRIKH